MNTQVGGLESRSGYGADGGERHTCDLHQVNTATELCLVSLPRATLTSPNKAHQKLPSSVLRAKEIIVMHKNCGGSLMKICSEELFM